MLKHSHVHSTPTSFSWHWEEQALQLLASLGFNHLERAPWPLRDGNAGN